MANIFNRCDFFEVFADILSKEWSVRPRVSFFIGGIICYFVANIAWLVSLKSGAGLARGVAIFSVASAVLAAVIGAFFYKEKLDVFQIAGIVLGCVSLLLIFWNEVF